MKDHKTKRKNDEKAQPRFKLSIPAIIGLAYIAIVLALANYHAVLPVNILSLVVYPYVMTFAIIHIISIVVIMLVWQLVWRDNEHHSAPIFIAFLGMTIACGILGAANIKHYLSHIGTVRVENTTYHLAKVRSELSYPSMQYDVFECNDGIGIFCRRMGITTEDGQPLLNYPDFMRNTAYITYDANQQVWIYIRDEGNDYNIQVTR